jgi:hypothetical protein
VTLRKVRLMRPPSGKKPGGGGIEPIHPVEDQARRAAEGKGIARPQLQGLGGIAPVEAAVAEERGVAEGQDTTGASNSSSSLS